MALDLTYTDAYLAPLVTEAREDAAQEFVAGLGTFPADWVDRLVRVRAYIVTCQESMKAPDDTFAAKLKAYASEFSLLLPQARAAQDAVDAAAGTATGPGSMFTVALVRS